MQYSISTGFFITLLLFFFASPLQADDAASGTITGTVIDRETEEPIPYAYVYLEGANKTQTSHSDGTFEFKNVSAGEYTITAQRIGYGTLSQTVEVPEEGTVEVEIRLQPSALSSEAIEIVGERERGRNSHLENATQRISGTDLRQNLGTTLASTLEDVPGLSSRSMGTAPGRPVMRGLGGERLMILQDGERTGDVSSQSSDHAVTVDPMSAEEIEIARGPAALEFGSNAIGGVINVVRNQIPSEQPDHLHGMGSVQGETVNSGGVSGMELSAPLGENFAVRFDGNLRSALNTETPEGTLENSGILSTNNTLGASYIGSWGHAGLSSNIYLNNYGIPPDPDGGHPNGVNIEMEKFQFDGESEIFLPDEALFKSLETDISHKSYFHQEIESSGNVGTEFGVLTSNASLKANHDEIGILDEGKIGIWSEAKDYAVNGTQTPDSDSYSLSAFLIEEKDIGPLHLEGGARYDWQTAIPAVENEDIQGREIRERSFSALSSSGSAVYDFGGGFFTGASIIHSFRAPSQEELFSQGPHLASYSYEVGNPDLSPERGLGKELFLRYRTSQSRAELTFFHNGFSNYNYARNTGERSIRDPSLFVYQFDGTEAVLSGVEFSSELQLFNNVAFSGSVSYTHGRRYEENGSNGGEWVALPMIPPLKGNASLTYGNSGFQAGSRVKFAANQDRTGEFETPTDGYAILNLFSQYRFEKWQLLHTVSLNANNLLNTTYRDHLSRIKELVPEPGRNISLLYRVYF